MANSALLNEGFRAHQAADLQRAEQCYRTVANEQPTNYDAHHLLGMVLAQTGRFDEAVDRFRRCVALQPENADALHNLARALLDAKQFPEAVEQFDKLVTKQPKSLKVAYDRANALLKSGDCERAIAAYKSCLALQPSFIEAMLNLGVAYQTAGNPEEAVQWFRKASKLKPQWGLAHLNLASCAAQLGQLDVAGEAYDRATKLEPNRADAWEEFGSLLLQTGDVERAMSMFDRSLKIDPAYAKAMAGRASALKALRQESEALREYERAIKACPDEPSLYANVGLLQAEAGKSEEARASYDRAVALAGVPVPEVSLRKLLALPVIYDSVEQIDQVRHRLSAEIEEFRRTPAHIADPLRQIGAAPFFLTYQGRNDRDINVRLAAAIRDACPVLQQDAGPVEPRKREKMRLAIVSAHLREHTIGFVNLGLIQSLPRERLEVVVVRPEHPADEFTRKIDAAADRVEFLPPSLLGAKQALERLEPDVIFYPDVGMEPLTYYLGFFRIAPVQCVGWGHPDTTGISTLDYYLSSETFDRPDAQDAYSEKLVRLPRIYNDLARSTDDATRLSRAEMGLPEHGALYLSPQNLFKFHPEFDETLNLILTKDPEGIVGIPAGANPEWTDLLRQRFARTCPGVAGRIHFIPRVAPERFNGMLTAADAIIDPVHFTGGYTSYLAFSCGMPVVTWDGALLRGRMTRGLYEQMGVEGLVAETSAQFADIAVRLAQDRDWRKLKAAEIDSSSSRIFDDRESIAALGEWFVQAESV